MKRDDKQAAVEYEAKWNAMVPSWREHQALRDSMYGIRVEDDSHEFHGGSFAVCCPEHGWIGDDLTIVQARELQDAHSELHSAA